MKRVSFTGDLLCKAPEIRYAGKDGKDLDFDDCFVDVIPLFSKSDLVIANLETPVAGFAFNYSNATSVFNSPREFLQSVVKSGITCFTLANNHVMDRGIVGLSETIKNINEVAPPNTHLKNERNYVGAQMDISVPRTLTKTIGETKLSFMSFTYGMNSEWLNSDNFYGLEDNINFFMQPKKMPIVFQRDEFDLIYRVKKYLKLFIPPVLYTKKKQEWIDCGSSQDISDPENDRLLNRMLNDIKDAKRVSDIVIMCLHIGGQYNNDIGDYTKYVTSKCIENGCDIVVCNHPHVVLGQCCLENGRIFYSLGNFFNTPQYGFYKEGVLSDYSIVLHLDLEEASKSIDGMKCSVVKCVRSGLHTKVVPVATLYEQATTVEKKHIVYDVYNVLCRLGVSQDIETFSIQKEYKIK